MLGLPEGNDESTWTRTARRSRKAVRKVNKAVMRSHHFHVPKYDLPLRLRPWFLVFTALILLSLAFLGFTNFSHSLPLNDKLLHFLCMGLATAVFYFIFDVEEDARRVWFWRSAPLIFTGVVCFFLGGIVSEFVQSMLPYKEFQVGDVAANLLGSTLGLYIAFHLERYYRNRREINRLYRPLDTQSMPSDDEEDDDTSGTQLLPLHNTPLASSAKPTTPNRSSIPKATRLSDVWDEREELFDIGEESDEEDEGPTNGRAGPPPPPPPKIVVTQE
uniref:Zn(2)-C6 fungal-type domain-containing protein n=1 Tax=Ganoderma boninense TaxID=34458 RepID=A0A5K1K0E7_9APHY|nr:Zn(2)-C6 fungal-type domain-containing protein [Ganoderma boninense]